MTSPVGAPGRRARGLLLAVLLAAAQGSAWVHAAIVAHVTCLEHGESIHALKTARGDAGPREAVGGTARLTGAEAAATAHEHCAGGALLRWRDVGLSAPAASAAPSALAPQLASPTDARRLTATAVYLVAPKTSPPFAAV